VQVDLLHHLQGQAARAEHENVTEVVAAPAQRVEELSLKKTRASETPTKLRPVNSASVPRE